MDIRKFFGGGTSAKPASKATPSKKATSRESTKKKEKTRQTSSDKNRNTSKKCEEITIDSDSDFDELKKTSKSKVTKTASKDKNGNIKEITSSTEVKKEKSIVDKKQRISSNKDCSVSPERTSNEKKKNKRHKSEEIDSLSPEPKKSAKKKNISRIVSSDDEDVIQPTKKKKKKSTSKKGVIFDSESEEENPIPKKKSRSKKKEFHFSSDDEEKQTSIQEAFQHAKSHQKAKPISHIVEKKSTPPKKAISVADFFGASSVKRSEKKTPSLQRKDSVKRKAENSPVKKIDNFEAMMNDDDDDFEETLRQLDENNTHKAKKARLSNEESKPSTLASKLSQKVKESYRVADTPEKPSTKKSPSKVSNKQISPAKPSSAKTTPAKAGSSKTTPVKTSPVKEKTPPSTSEKKPNVGYRSYLNREGPRSLGSKEVPQGGENCLEGLTFVITGVLDSFDRDEMKGVVERYGGKVTGNVSKKTSYLVAGRDSGESKLTKAQSFGTKIVDEDGVLDLLRSLPGKKSKYELAAEKECKSTPANKSQLTSKSSTSASPLVRSMSSTPKSDKSAGPPSLGRSPSTQSIGVSGGGDDEYTLLWVDKYKPTTLKQIIGQQGDKSNAKKLLTWLKNWHKNVASGKKPTFNRFSDDGSGYKAALLSGPPGVGKTTTSHLVCKQAGFSFVELNASDTRSKKSLQSSVAESLNNCSLTGYFGGSAEKAVGGHDHCLVMDEVDGMAGNEDRGGIQELVGLIKNSKIPIICMCNDRNHQKMRTLSNYCFDLRFQRPRVEQIKSAMMSLAFKEGIKIPPPALNDIIMASNQDVRQVIHNLSMWSATNKNMSHDQVKIDAAKAKKDLKMGPFDVVRKVFTVGDETANMSLRDKSDLFFHDYSFGPLFVQENYINVQPLAARGDVKKHLQCLSKAAHNIALGDRVDRMIRGRMKWNLLPLQAMYASVLPGEAMRGYLGGQIQFPSWLGKNSTTNKNDRILQELKSHMKLKISCDKKGLNMDYLPHMRHSLTSPLVTLGSDGVHEVVENLAVYDLLKDDFDSILEVSKWPNSVDVMAKVETKTKSAFTRTYNKESHMTPYATAAAKKGGRRGGGGGTDYNGEMEGDGEGTSQAVESAEEEDMSVDSMIKKKTAAKKGKASESKGKGSAKGKGQAKGKAPAKGKGRGKGK